MSPETATILNIKIDSTQTSSVLRFIRSRLVKFDSEPEKSQKFYIVTPNPEQIMRAQEDKAFAEILNSADISLPDGIGLIAANKFFQLPTTDSTFLKPMLYFAQGLGVGFSILFDRNWLEEGVSVVKGRVMFTDLIKLANKKGWRTYLLGGWNKVAQRTKVNLEKNYKNVLLKAATGPVLDDNGTPINKTEKVLESNVVKDINTFKPHILFVGFRAPAQEKWLSRMLPRLSVGGAMVVGSTFNYLSGQAKLPPKWIADAGLEWVWRLLTGSQNTKRVSKAVIDFPLKIFFSKLNG